ncbi:MAG: response regulator [Phycisphaerales bacterium]|nr:response regulator [Phycisphaerales bacterium]
MGHRFDVIPSPPEPGSFGEGMGGSGSAGPVGPLDWVHADVILSRAGDFVPAERELLGRQSAAILEALGEGACLADSEGRVLWANHRFLQLDEQTRARVESVCRRAGHRFGDHVTGHGGGAGAHHAGAVKFEIASPDGNRFFEVVVSPVGSVLASGDPMLGESRSGMAPSAHPPWHADRVVAIVWDVTALRRVQHKLEAVDRAGRELVRLDADLIRRMHIGERLKVLEQKIVKFAHDLLHFDHFTIRLLDERTGKLELVMATGLPAEALEIELYANREGSGISGYVAATGRSYLCPDVTQDRRYIMGLGGARSSLTIPLLLHDKVIGILNVESERPNAFTEEDRQFAEMFSTHVALALHILDLLVVERCATGETVTGTVQGELSEPLQDIIKEADWLKSAAGTDIELRRHIDRILADVDAIRRRVKEAASGPQNILGAEKALIDLAIDPQMVGRNVLVADDEPKIRQIIRDVLGGRGCRVTVCDNGGAAIAQLESTIDQPEGRRFDLVISDIKMPDRNGFEVFSAAKRIDPSLPVILMTGFGYDPHHSIVRASQEGLQCVLFKPFQMERLIEEVRKALAPGATPCVAEVPPPH